MLCSKSKADNAGWCCQPQATAMGARRTSLRPLATPKLSPVPTPHPSAAPCRHPAYALVCRYLRGNFAPGDADANLVQAANALYELLARLRRVAGKQDSEDAKAPLKAIRDAVDSCAFNR